MGFPFGVHAGLYLCAYAAFVCNDKGRGGLMGGFAAGFSHCFKRRVRHGGMTAKGPRCGDRLTAGGRLNSWRSGRKTAGFATNFANFAGELGCGGLIRGCGDFRLRRGFSGWLCFWRRDWFCG